MGLSRVNNFARSSAFVRLVGLYKDFAALASGDNGLRTIAGETKNNRWRVKRQAADFLLQQMTLAAEEAR